MQLETPNDIALKADAELAHATLLTTEGATCVAVRNDEVAITRERGVKPLLQWISEGRSFEGWSIAESLWAKRRLFCTCSSSPLWSTRLP